jgi:hypothetical protein
MQRQRSVFRELKGEAADSVRKRQRSVFRELKGEAAEAETEKCI